MNVTLSILHFTTTFHNFAFKIETSWAKRAAKPIFETRNVNDFCMLYFSWHKVLICCLKNQWLSSFHCVLLHHKTCWGSWNLVITSLGIPLPIQLTFLDERFLTASWNKINHFAILKHLHLHTLLLSQLYHDDLKALGI